MAYIGVSPSNGVRQKHTYTATASQTTFSGAGSEGVSLSYRDSNYVDVYRNGVKLGDADYTATSGTSVVLGEGAAVSDIIEIVTYDVFSVADTVSKADGGTFDGNVTMAGTLDVTGETTLSANLNLGDNDKAIFGAGDDLQIYHDGSNSYIDDNGTGVLNIRADSYAQFRSLTNENIARFHANGSVDLYYDNSKKLATTNTGIDVTGTAVTDGLTVAGNVSIDGGTIKLDGNYPTGTDNVALGNAVLNGSLTGGYNTAMGATAMTALTSGSLNVGLGRVALGSLTSGSYNTGVGANALNANTTASNNTAVGYNALTANTTGSQNVGIGDGSLSANTTASNNVSVGYFSMDSNTTGTTNVAVGASALRSNTTASSNTAVGYQAGYSNTTGNSNVAVGAYSQDANTTGNQNTSIGYDSLTTNTTGSQNTALGREALRYNTEGNQNVAVGATALEGNTTGDANVAMGYVALRNNTTANFNVAVGNQSLQNNTTGSSNNSFGSTTLLNCTTGSNNTAFGHQAMNALTTGSSNTAFGVNAGLSITTPDSNTFIGRNAGSQITTGASNTILGRYQGNSGGLDIRTSSNNIVLSDGSGNPRQITTSGGTTTWTTNLSDSERGNSTLWNTIHSDKVDNVALFIENSSAGPYGIFIDFSDADPDNNGNYFIKCEGSTGAERFKVFSDGDVQNHDNSYGALSDIKLKEQITDASSQWDDIKALTVRKYKMKSDVATGDSDAHWRLGVVAQEVETAGMSGLVKDNPDLDKNNNDLGTTTKTVKYSILYMKAVKALQEAMERIETLEAKVATLEGE